MRIVRGAFRAMSRRSAFAIRLASLALLAALVAHWVDLAAVARLLLRLPIPVLAAGLALGLLRVFLMALRWRVLDGAGYDGPGSPIPKPLHLGSYLRYRLLNATLNLVLPSGLGADAGRATLVALEVSEGRAQRIAVLAFDRLLGLGTLAVLGLAAGLLAPAFSHRAAFLICVGALLAVLGGAVGAVHVESLRRASSSVLRRSAPGRVLQGVLESWRICTLRLRHTPARLSLAVALALLAHATSFALVFLAARALGARLSIEVLAVATTISWVVTLLPVSIGGLGLREMTFVAMLVPEGVLPAAAAAIAFFQFAVVALIGLAASPLLLVGRPAHSSLPSPPERMADADGT